MGERPFLEAESWGSSADASVLLISGTGAPMQFWPEAFCPRGAAAHESRSQSRCATQRFLDQSPPDSSRQDRPLAPQAGGKRCSQRTFAETVTPAVATPRGRPRCYSVTLAANNSSSLAADSSCMPGSTCE